MAWVATRFRIRIASRLIFGDFIVEYVAFAPGLKRATAIMFNPNTAPVSTYMPSLEIAARSLKVVPIIAPVHSDVEIETAIIALGREPGGGLVVPPDAFMAVHRARITLAAAQNNVPAVYGLSFYARDGGLLSYGNDPEDMWRKSQAISRCSCRPSSRWP